MYIYTDTAKQLSDNIKAKLKALGYERYKYIVQVLIGERRDQGVRMGTRCFWDSATDNQVAYRTLYALYAVKFEEMDGRKEGRKEGCSIDDVDVYNANRIE